ncbi:unnamed protein product [Heligmosomoides polygyrus]|uniref:NFX1-type zinc finger-containing protein 1 n=1 Tax=Heligmosomoides polygyrus TaxID=6339 RepID=A0A3P7YQ35_HELPZ|nr:unnamed protein product [Heligmosomoides polygyrus]
MQKFHFVCEWQKSVRTKQHAEVLRRSLVVFATTTGAAKERELLERLRCPIVFVEEAALILEPHTLAALHPAVEHVVLIGDHQQLRPNVAMYTLAHEYHLDVSMFERLVRNGYPYSTLQVQHRMNKDIADNIVRPYFYPNCPFQITILTTYSAQTRAMKEAITEIFGQSPDGQPSIGVVNVDAFQGKENRIIILSLVRSMVDGIGFLSVKNRITVALTRARHGMYVVGNLVYLSDCSSFWRRMALDLFDKDFASSELPIRCQRHGNVQVSDEFAEKSPEGGCLNICDADLPCGHKCPRRCHPTDDHESFQCKQPCSRRCKNEQYRHPCRRACYEVHNNCFFIVDVKLCDHLLYGPLINGQHELDCGECFHVVTARLLCGHSTNVTCAMVAKAVCHERCKNILGCGHQCRATCGKPCDTKCLEVISYTPLSLKKVIFQPVTVSNDVCNHTWEVPCSEADVSRQCPVRCPEILPCGHNCAELCGQPCTFDCKEVSKTLEFFSRLVLVDYFNSFEIKLNIFKIKASVLYIKQVTLREGRILA